MYIMKDQINFVMQLKKQYSAFIINKLTTTMHVVNFLFIYLCVVNVVNKGKAKKLLYSLVANTFIVY